MICFEVGHKCINILGQHSDLYLGRSGVVVVDLVLFDGSTLDLFACRIERRHKYMYE